VGRLLALPLLARIVSLCDAFNAMTSDRSYRKAMPLEEAIAELRRVRGAQFDPQVVDALIEVVGVCAAEAQIENIA
jgi:HD-GYP domain-containing protein (c-di-GMP phosphodiesterase class II)